MARLQLFLEVPHSVIPDGELLLYCNSVTLNIYVVEHFQRLGDIDTKSLGTQTGFLRSIPPATFTPQKYGLSINKKTIFDLRSHDIPNGIAYIFLAFEKEGSNRKVISIKANINGDTHLTFSILEPLDDSV